MPCDILLCRPFLLLLNFPNKKPLVRFCPVEGFHFALCLGGLQRREPPSRAAGVITRCGLRLLLHPNCMPREHLFLRCFNPLALVARFVLVASIIHSALASFKSFFKIFFSPARWSGLAGVVRPRYRFRGATAAPVLAVTCVAVHRTGRSPRNFTRRNLGRSGRGTSRSAARAPWRPARRPWTLRPRPRLRQCSG